ncbi:MAG: transcription elongation factor GreA [Desulfobacterales bacterium]|nr:transcription elongation factor GreA [Desulfobacterales bacterium]
MSGKVPMTREGHKSLIEELRRLKTKERPKIINEIAIAREHGDLSENAEYDAAKEKQSFIEGRIREIEDKLSRAEVIDANENDTNRVVFGTVVHLRDENDGNELKYQIVGADEADPRQRKISVHSPIARALIGKEVGELVKIKVPAGIKEYTILEINL